MNRRDYLKGVLLLMLCVALVTMFTPSASQAQEDPQVPKYNAKVEVFSGMSMLITAKALGMREIAGKDLTLSAGSPGKAKARKLGDVGIGIDPVIHENEPTVVANPKKKKKLVAGSHTSPVAGGIRCVAYTSSDRGATWSAPVVMPSVAGLDSMHSDPVLAYAPDGSRVYYAYMDIKYGSDYDIVVSYSDDDGQTWNGPIIALDGIPGQFVYDKCWIGTHIGPNQRNWVYVTATQFDYYGVNPDHIAFARSGDKGMTWSSTPTLIDTALFPVVVQGSRSAGGLGGDVMVAYYHSSSDGWLTGAFEIRVAYSADHGATFNAPVTAVLDEFELPFWLGPYSSYHRWWGAMEPDIEFDFGGKAHIIYTHDPEENLPYPYAYSLTPEDGDIRYITSSHHPYGAGTWSAPVTINDDGTGSAQGYAALKPQHRGRSTTLHAIWEDHRLTPVDNLYYDIFYSRKVPGHGVGWFNNLRVSEASSISDYIFIGDYNDCAANQTVVFGIWTDRRHQTSIYPSEDNVFGSRIIPGGGQGN